MSTKGGRLRINSTELVLSSLKKSRDDVRIIPKMKPNTAASNVAQILSLTVVSSPWMRRLVLKVPLVSSKRKRYPGMMDQFHEYSSEQTTLQAIKAHPQRVSAITRMSSDDIFFCRFFLILFSISGLLRPDIL